MKHLFTLAVLLLLVSQISFATGSPECVEGLSSLKFPSIEEAIQTLPPALIVVELTDEGRSRSRASLQFRDLLLSEISHIRLERAILRRGVRVIDIMSSQSVRRALKNKDKMVSQKQKSVHAIETKFNLFGPVAAFLDYNDIVTLEQNLRKIVQDRVGPDKIVFSVSAGYNSIEFQDSPPTFDATKLDTIQQAIAVPEATIHADKHRLEVYWTQVDNSPPEPHYSTHHAVMQVFPSGTYSITEKAK